MFKKKKTCIAVWCCWCLKAHGHWTPLTEQGTRLCGDVMLKSPVAHGVEFHTATHSNTTYWFQWVGNWTKEKYLALLHSLRNTALDLSSNLTSSGSLPLLSAHTSMNFPSSYFSQFEITHCTCVTFGLILLLSSCTREGPHLTCSPWCPQHLTHSLRSGKIWNLN